MTKMVVFERTAPASYGKLRFRGLVVTKRGRRTEKQGRDVWQYRGEKKVNNTRSATFVLRIISAGYATKENEDGMDSKELRENCWTTMRQDGFSKKRKGSGFSLENPNLAREIKTKGSKNEVWRGLSS